VSSARIDHRRRVIAAVVVPLVLVTAACGSSESSSKKTRTISDITVKGGYTKAPTVNFPKPFNVAKTQTKVLERGSGNGTAVKPDSIITIKLVEYVGRDGGSVGADESTAIRPWTQSSEPYTFALTPDSTIRGIRAGLLGAKAGDTILFAIAPKDAYDPTGNGVTVSPGDSIVAVVNLLSVRDQLTKATGTKEAAPASVPALQLNAKGVPTGFKSGGAVPKKVGALGVYPVIRGKGPQVRAGQNLTVEYLGEVYPDKKVFDQSWSRKEPSSLKLGEGGVIKGWDQGLVGQRVGSRVILVIPSKLGYGKTGQPGGGIPKNADLIFAVDILGAY
jgi:peptidylprolyl isomerase